MAGLGSIFIDFEEAKALAEKHAGSFEKNLIAITRTGPAESVTNAFHSALVQVIINAFIALEVKILEKRDAFYGDEARRLACERWVEKAREEDSEG